MYNSLIKQTQDVDDSGVGISGKIPVSGLKTRIFYWAQLDSNQRPMDYESTGQKSQR